MKEPLRPAGRDPTLPDFLVIGAPKSGTTALMMNLGQHPQVAMARLDGHTSELHFFNKHWDKGLDWYRRFFTDPERLQGEKTPDYIGIHGAMERMAATVPDARLIVCLRNPVDRAYSHWNHFNQIAEISARWGWVVETFEQAFERPNSPLFHFSHYARHLKKLFSLYPREQVHIVISERLREHGEEEYGKLLGFLGLEPSQRPFGNHHERDYAEAMSDATRARLERVFAPLNEDLFAVLGERIDEWPSAKPAPRPRRPAKGRLRLGFLTDCVAEVSGGRLESTGLVRLGAAVAARGPEIEFAAAGADDTGDRLASLVSTEDVDAVVLDIRSPWRVLSRIPADCAIVFVRDLAEEAQWRAGLFGPATHLAAATSHIASRIAAKTGRKPMLLRLPRMVLPFTLPEMDEGALVLVVLQGSLPVALAAALRSCPEIPVRTVAAEEVHGPDALAGARLAVYAGPWCSLLANIATELQRAGVPGVAARCGEAAEMLGNGGLLVTAPEQPAAWAEALRELWHNATRWEECSRAAMLHAGTLQREEEESSARLVAILEKPRSKRAVAS